MKAPTDMTRHMCSAVKLSANRLRERGGEWRGGGGKRERERERERERDR